MYIYHNNFCFNVPMLCRGFFVNTELVRISLGGRIGVDMLTGPVAAAPAAVATGAWVKSKHDMYLIRGSVGA